MPSQLSPQGGVSESPQSQVLQISEPIFHLIHQKNKNNESLCRFEKHQFVVYASIPHLPVMVFIPKDCNLFPLKIL